MAGTVQKTAPSGFGAVAKRILIGRQVSSSRLEHTLLPKVLALPVFSSDALSSVAYATEEILLVLLTASATARHLVMPIAVSIALVMVIVISSYRQTVRAYPSGGGAYIVSRENLGQIPGLVAAAALLTDYVLTVAVSITAGVFAITSAANGLLPYSVWMALGFIALVTLANLRGVKESGTLFAIPTYCFILSIFTMLVLGLADCLVGGCPQVDVAEIHVSEELATGAGAITLFTILRAFSSGSTALTGVEAISNGVPAFRRPQSKNASETLALMGVIAISMFLGISYLASEGGATISHERSVVGQVADAVFGGGVGFYVVMIFTAGILILAANTAYQDFPRLASILARDRYFPRQFENRGDRLVFSNGVIVLAGLAGALVYAFDADLSRLIQLYVVGVFTSFTLSQAGMVRHWHHIRKRGGPDAKGTLRSMAINAIGACATGVVLVVITATKFTHGAWIVITAMPFIVMFFLWVHRHYREVTEHLRRGRVAPGEVHPNHVVLLVPDIDPATAEALGYVRATRPTDVRAVHFAEAGAAPAELVDGWTDFARGLPLEVLPRGRRRLLGAVREYVEAIPREPDAFVTVVIPELVHRRSVLAHLLARWDLFRLKAGLLRLPNIVVADAPVQVDEGVHQGVDARPLIPTRTTALVFVSGVHDASIRAVNYAATLGVDDARAVFFALEPEESGEIVQRWGEAHLGMELDVVEAPFRDLTTPLLQEIRRETGASPDSLVVAVLPELVVKRWWHFFLHNQKSLFIKRQLLLEPRVVLASVPYHVE
jgi:amino acid transporter